MIKFENGYRIAYDDLTDTLYITGLPRPATDSYLDEDYVLVRSVDGKINGLTIEGFKDRLDDGSWTDTLILKYLPMFNPSCLSSIFSRLEEV